MYNVFVLVKIRYIKYLYYKAKQNSGTTTQNRPGPKSHCACASQRGLRNVFKLTKMSGVAMSMSNNRLPNMNNSYDDCGQKSEWTLKIDAGHAWNRPRKLGDGNASYMFIKRQWRGRG